MPYNTDPFQQMLAQRQQPRSAQPMSEDDLRRRQERFQALGLEDTALGRGSQWAAGQRGALDASKNALKESATSSLLGGAASAAL